MSNLKLTIDLLPKGAWGNNLSKTLSKKDWDTLRNNAYAKAGNRCAICGYADGQLDAHEVWDFDIKSRTQTLKDIVSLCSACHGVKHMRNSERIGYGDQAREHFLKINKCSSMAFATHFARQQFLFEERNQVLRWRVKADLSQFGGKGIEIVERSMPLILNPYENLNWNRVIHQKVFKTVPYRDLDEPALTPFVYSIEVNNYDGTIAVIAFDTNKIQWISGGEIFKTKYNNIGKFITKFSVEDFDGDSISFRLVGNGGETHSQEFVLQKYS